MKRRKYKRRANLNPQQYIIKKANPFLGQKNKRIKRNFLSFLIIFVILFFCVWTYHLQVKSALNSLGNTRVSSYKNIPKNSSQQHNSKKQIGNKNVQK